MITIVFPGQGSQYQGMAKDFYDNFKEVKKIFEKVQDSTGINVKKIIFEDTNNLLNITKYTQICIFTASISIFESLKLIFQESAAKLNVNFVMGHSLGEYTALTASESISLIDCAKLLKIRGELMQDAYPENQSGMAALVGLDCIHVEKIIKDNNLNLEVANDNAPGQVVVSGVIDDLKNSEKIFLSNRVKKIFYLNVSSAFHSKIMKKAEENMKKSLERIQFKIPKFPIISNFSGESSKEISVIYNNLCQQMSNKVKWTDSIKYIDRLNEKNIVEIGPGKVLTGIIKRISKNFNYYNINEIADIEKIKNEL